MDSLARYALLQGIILRVVKNDGFCEFSVRNSDKDIKIWVHAGIESEISSSFGESNFLFWWIPFYFFSVALFLLHLRLLTGQWLTKCFAYRLDNFKMGLFACRGKGTSNVPSWSVSDLRVMNHQYFTLQEARNALSWPQVCKKYECLFNLELISFLCFVRLL